MDARTMRKSSAARHYGRPCKVRSLDQEYTQESTGDNIECQAETGPPHWDPWIFNEQMMKKVKNSMSGQSHCYKPEIRFEPHHSNSQKGTRNERLDQYRVHGGPHNSKQDVISGDDDQQRWVENAITIKSGEQSEDEHRQRKNNPDQ